MADRAGLGVVSLCKAIQAGHLKEERERNDDSLRPVRLGLNVLSLLQFNQQRVQICIQGRVIEKVNRFLTFNIP